MNQDLSIISLIMGASWVVQLVVAGLLLVSLASWSVIFAKLAGLARVRGRNDQFEQEFWSGKNLNDLYQSASTKVDRRDFGLTWNQALETGGILVGDQVKISLEVELVKPAA